MCQGCQPVMDGCVVVVDTVAVEPEPVLPLGLDPVHAEVWLAWEVPGDPLYSQHGSVNPPMWFGSSMLSGDHMRRAADAGPMFTAGYPV